MRFLSIVLISLFLAGTAYADPDFSKQHQSVFKVVVFKSGTKTPKMVASAFALKTPGGVPVLLTNNHVCEDLHVGDPTIKVQVVQSMYNPLKEVYHPIVEMSMLPGTDVCAIKTNHMGGYTYLQASSREAQYNERVWATGYHGTLEDLIIESGYIYQTESYPMEDTIQKCSEFEPIAIEDKLLCLFIDEYFTYQYRYVVNFNGRIAPGFSGSPILTDEGKVVGIVSMYNVATKFGIYEALTPIYDLIENAQYTPTDTPFARRTVRIKKWQDRLYSWGKLLFWSKKPLTKKRK